MKKVAVLVGFLVLLLAGGALTSQLGLSVPLKVQTLDPNGSVFDATPEKATVFILIVGFILFNVIGAGLTLMALFWVGNRAVARAKASDSASGEGDSSQKALASE